MRASEIYRDAFSRIPELVHMAADGISAEALSHRIEADANSIAWLVWHLTRIQDHHISEIAGRDQEYVAGGWSERLLMAPDIEETGHGHTSDQVASIRPATADDLLGYHDAVIARTMDYLPSVDDPGELDRIIDDRWDPPVTVGVRLVSVVSDNIQHAGQARYLRGVYDRLGIS